MSGSSGLPLLYSTWCLLSLNLNCTSIPPWLEDEGDQMQKKTYSCQRSLHVELVSCGNTIPLLLLYKVHCRAFFASRLTEIRVLLSLRTLQ